MIDMDTYEQKYNEALEAAQQIYKDMQSGGNYGGMEDLEVIFPELRESEDERIRKELVQFLTEIKNISEGGRDSWHVRKEDAKMCTDFLAYLEKQKEQKPAEWKPSEEQMEALEYVIRDYREDSCNATANYLQEILDHLKNM